ncbi:non-ribosomal peptide synthetase [Clostridium hydrogenum]|uniref:non-ribosomal peptide synthetase n=1 Tax=Clostridium hydrogenum TaxID=2855764 RepID=UPI001F417440|nr:non-ribosomal peptide synthetase [Clostridium hydrogenum]
MSTNKLLNITKSVFDIISEITGHPVENLETDMFLESDLGFDSIKMINLMNSLMKLVPKEDIQAFTEKYSISSLMTLDTIGEIINVFETWNSSNEDEVKLNNVDELDMKETEKLEILNSQYPFLASYFAVGTMTICSGVKISGELNLEVLQESYTEIIRNNITLRAYFKADETASSFEDYEQLLYEKESSPEIEVYDFQNLDKNAQEEEKYKFIRNTINTKFSIFQWPLHKVSLIKTKVSEYEVIFSNNHLIADGLGNQEIVRELLEVYSAKLSNKEKICNRDITAARYNELVKNINSYSDLETNEKLKEYLKKQGREKYFFNPLNLNKNVLDKFAKVDSVKYWIDEKTLHGLNETARKFRVSLFTLLVSAYVKTVVKIQTEEENLILNLPTGGKNYPGMDLDKQIGCFAQNMAIKFSNIGKYDDIETVVKKVNSETKIILTSGFDREQVNNAARELKNKKMLENGQMTEITASFIRSSLKSNLYMSFMGNTKISENYNSIKVIDYEAYTGTNSGAIDNILEIFQNRLLISSNYDSLFFDRNFIEKLIGSFIEELKEVSQKKDEFKTLGTVKNYNHDTAKKVCDIINEVSKVNVKESDFESDLEAQFGIDSLEKIRIITRINKQFKHINRDNLFDCRSISEFAVVIDSNANITMDTKNVIEKEEEIKLPFVKIMKQCSETPNAPAVNFMNDELSYGKLDDLSNRLAHYLRKQGANRNNLIGIMTLPGPLMLVGMLGILKSGAAYVPIDPNYPADRIKYILNNSDIKILISEQELKDDILGILKNNEILEGVVFLDDGDLINEPVNFVQVQSHIWRDYSNEAPIVINEPEDLMLVIYTSGSTGNPKGVMLTHEGYMNRLVWHQKLFKLKPKERVAQRTSCCFDISIWELFWTLMYGGTVCPVRKNIVRNPWKLAQWMIDLKINIMHFVPSLFGEFVNSIEDEEYEFKDLRCLVYSGEALPMSFIQKWIDKYGMKTSLTNLYGPTEASIDVTYHVIDRRPGSMGETSIPIGKPIDNVYILSLDENMQEVSNGETGELWIGGIQLAKGYLNNKEKTEAAFKPNPFKHIPGKYLYRTGDLTVKNENGSFDYHGRIDNQIKIRGFRVELGEIEAVLDSSPKIKEAAVVAVNYKDNQKRLVAFIVGEKVSDNDIKSLVASKVPEYMVPHSIKWIEELPKTPNGKTDRKALIKLITDSNKSEKTEDSNNSKEQILPLAPAQRWLMSYFDYPYEWAGFTRFKYKENLDFGAFNKALTLLSHKHEILRCKLDKQGNKWVQKILPSESMEVTAEYYDASNGEIGQKENKIQELIISKINELRFDKWPLWKTIVIKTNENEYDISVVGHHLISDVITNKLLFEDIWKFYSKVLLDGEISPKVESKTYSDFINTLELEKNNKENEFIEYWLNKFPNEEAAFNISYDFDKGANLEKTSDIKSFTLDEKLTSTLLGRAKKYYKSNVYSMLLAPLYKNFSEASGKNQVVISHRVHGRNLNEKMYFDTAGNFAINFPLSLDLGDVNGYEGIVAKIQKEFESVPLNGCSYDLVAEKLPFYMYPDSKLTAVRANYLGNRQLVDYESFEFSKENFDKRFSMPNQKRTVILEFFFYIEAGKVVLDLEYSKNLFKAETIEKMGKDYINSLTNLISQVKPSVKENEIKENKEDKVVLITGGSRGIGKEIAVCMAEKYKTVAIVGRNNEDLLKVAKEIEKRGSVPYIIKADITDLEKIKSEINDLVSSFGKIDILVNNAGITKMSTLIETDPKDWINIINTNLIGTYNLCFAVAPYMVERQEGKIINIGSDSSLIGYPLMTAYAASKHGILGLTKALSEELKLKNVQVNAVCPALVATDMAPSALKNSAIAPIKVAKIVMFLASKDADCITGEAIQVNGRQDMYWFGSKQMDMLKRFI